MALTKTQEDALAVVAAAREAERAAIEEAKQRMWREIALGPRKKVAAAILAALEVGVSKRQIRFALGNKNDRALDPYLGVKSE